MTLTHARFRVPDRGLRAGGETACRPRQGDPEQVIKKIDEIEQRIRDFGLDPNVAVEKRLRSPFHRILQQRVGDHRVWFYDDPEEEVLVITFVGHKEEAQRELGG